MSHFLNPFFESFFIWKKPYFRTACIRDNIPDVWDTGEPVITSNSVGECRSSPKKEATASFAKEK